MGIKHEDSVFRLWTMGSSRIWLLRKVICIKWALDGWMGFSLSHCLGGGGEAPAEQFPRSEPGCCRSWDLSARVPEEGATQRRSSRNTAVGLLSSPKYGSYRAAQWNWQKIATGVLWALGRFWTSHRAWPSQLKRPLKPTDFPLGTRETRLSTKDCIGPHLAMMKMIYH